jgi:membrane-associated phospholipid phosphatase
MLFVPLVIAVLITSATAYYVILRWPSIDPASPRATRRAAEQLRREESRHGRLAFLAGRDATLATGLLLTIAASAVIVGGLILGALALLVRGNSAVVSLDLDISRWVNGHDTTFTHRTMNALTNLGAGSYVVALAVLLAIIESVRLRSRWIVPFLAVLLIGESLITTAVKNALHRARPALNPTAHFLGPSFPSGHTATAAAFFAGAALLMGRGRGRRAHALLAGLAVGAAVTVACTRVLLDVHWLSDVLGGLALGWAWFALCSMAFGGRLLRFGAPVAAATIAPVPPGGT